MQRHRRPGAGASEADRGTRASGPPMLEVARDYLARGYCPIPQEPGAKKPCVRWRPFQDRPPDEHELGRWFAGFAGAGIALVLGPAFNLFVVDVDGRDARDVLVERLGGEPRAPTVLSGSGDPFRRHYYFRHPPLATKARSCPWHDKLEFRGYRGIVVAPPSLHKSGNRYRWADGRSLDDLDPPAVPDPILAALAGLAARGRRVPRGARPPGVGTRSPSGSPAWGACGVTTAGELERLAQAGACLASRRFVAGEFADAPGWNDRLFRAAADLAGCGLPLDEAEPLLFGGAGPWTPEDDEAARRTIASAYAQEREPARELAARRGPLLRGRRGAFTITTASASDAE